MSVWSRLFGRSKSSRSVRKPAEVGARLRLESLESREVPAIVFVGGWGASSYQYAFAGSAGSAMTGPGAPAPASDYMLVLDGVKGESRDDVRKETIEIASWSLGAVPRGGDVVADGRGTTGETADSSTIAVGGYIRIKKLHSGG